MNKALSYSTKVQAEDVLQAARKVGNEPLVLKLLHNKRLDKSEKDNLLQQSSEICASRNQQTAQMLNHLRNVKMQMGPTDAAEVTLEKMQQAAGTLNIDLSKQKLKDDDYMSIADKLRGLD